MHVAEDLDTLVGGGRSQLDSQKRMSVPPPRQGLHTLSIPKVQLVQAVVFEKNILPGHNC